MLLLNTSHNPTGRIFPGESLKALAAILHAATFYLLVKAPIDDDVEFARRLRRDHVLVPPERTVDLPGYLRISLTATDDMIDRALPVFAAAMRAVGLRDGAALDAQRFSPSPVAAPAAAHRS